MTALSVKAGNGGQSMDVKGFEQMLFELEEEGREDEILAILEDNEDLVMLYNKWVGAPVREYNEEYGETYKKLDRWVSHMVNG